MYLVHVWYDDVIHWSKIVRGTIPTPLDDLKVKVTDLEFYIKVLNLSFYNISFCEAFDGFDSCLACW